MKGKYKNHCYILILFLSFNSITFSQIKYIGGSVGYNLSGLRHQTNFEDYSYKYRKCMRAGIFLEYKLKKNFLIHTELNYTMRGTDYNVNSWPVTPENKAIYKFDYVEVPIIFQYNINIHRNIKPKIFIGPEISFLINAKDEFINYGQTMAEYNLMQYYKTTEYGLIFGLGIDYLLPFGKIIMDVRFNYGLNNIHENESYKIYSEVISFNLGYAFSIM